MTTEKGIFETIYNCPAMRRPAGPVPEALLPTDRRFANQARPAPTAGARWIVVREGDSDQICPR